MADVMQGGFLRRDTDGALIVVGDGEAAEVKFAPVAAEQDGDNIVVAAVAGKQLRVVGYQLAGTGAGTITIKSDSTAIAHLVVGAAGGGAVYAGSAAAPAFETAAGEALVVTNPTGVDTYGHLAYVEV